MDPIKEAFSKIKEDIILLKNEIKNLNEKLEDIQTNPTHNINQIPQQTDTQTHIQTNPTHNIAVETLCTKNTPISTGNNGVPTDTLTNKQIHQQTQNNPNLTDFKQINNILESLDDIKKEIRLKFKRLTPQEMLVFSTLYALEDQGNKEITYKTIALQLKLSESSIRDYINKLIIKGVPIGKTRQNNKIILLNISQDLKKIATLSTIQTLKDL